MPQGLNFGPWPDLPALARNQHFAAVAILQVPGSESANICCDLAGLMEANIKNSSTATIIVLLDQCNPMSQMTISGNHLAGNPATVNQV